MIFEVSRLDFAVWLGFPPNYRAIRKDLEECIRMKEAKPREKFSGKYAFARPVQTIAEKLEESEFLIRFISKRAKRS